jgi:ABC-type uncharacterized transport system involved in gliding motility auxiliary subunit
MRRNQDSRSNTRILSVLGVFTLLIGLIIMLLLPDIKLAAWGVMVLGVILLVAALIFDFRKVKGALTGRRGRFGAGTTLMASLFIGITLLVNGISVSAYHRFDVTKLARFTLTEQTKDVLVKLDKPVKAICFFVPAKDSYGIAMYAENLIKEYMKFTDKLTYQVIDPDESPEKARKYGVFQYQSIVFESGDSRRMVYPTQIMSFDTSGNVQSIEAEHAFTSALLEVTGIAQKKIYFVTGHGEVSLTGNYSYVLNGLRDDLYIVGELDLMTYSVIPDDTAVLVIASPKKQMTDGEIQAINNYLAAGGQALIMADPGFPEQLNDILIPWGLKFDDGTVIDRLSSLGSRSDIPRVTADSNYFSSIGLNIVSYFPGAVGVSYYSEDTTTAWPSLISSSSASFLDKDFISLEQSSYDEAKGDILGPISMGMLVDAALQDNQAKWTRIIAIGDSDFASNEHYGQVNNSDLLLNSISWLADETKLISIRRAVQPYRRLVVNNDEVNFITYSSLIIPPILVLLVGGIIWWYRRT